MSSTTRRLPTPSGVASPAARVDPVAAASRHAGIVPIHYRIVTITPETAERLLARRRAGARRRAAVVLACADAMRDGRWRLDGTPIVLSHEGIVLDGLQRLLASVESACVFETLLAEGVDPAATFGPRRTPRPCRGKGQGGPGARQVRDVRAALVELLNLDGRHDQPRGSAELDQALLAHPRIGEAVRVSRVMPAGALPESVRAALICLTDEGDRAAVARLLDAIARPHAFASSEPGAVLRQRLDDAARAHRVTAGEDTWLAQAMAALRATPAPMPQASANAPAIDAMDGGTLHHGLPQVAVETIGPLHAARHLLHASHHLLHAPANGRISRPRVEALARDIVDARWLPNGHPIAFGSDGRLLDGRHRLRAIILAGQAVELAVLRGLPVDQPGVATRQEAPRALRRERLESFGDRALLTAMANLLWRHEMRPPAGRRSKATAAEVATVVRLHPRLILLRGYARRMTDFARPSVIGYAAYRFEREDAEQARRFLTSLETGADLSPGHPILALRNTLQKHRIAKASQGQQLALLLAGWEGFTAWCLSPRAQRRGQRRAGAGAGAGAGAPRT